MNNSDIFVATFFFILGCYFIHFLLRIYKKYPSFITNKSIKYIFSLFWGIYTQMFFVVGIFLLLDEKIYIPKYSIFISMSLTPIGLLGSAIYLNKIATLSLEADIDNIDKIFWEKKLKLTKDLYSDVFFIIAFIFIGLIIYLVDLF